MSKQYHVAANLQQDFSSQEKARARSNIGVVKMIPSNINSKRIYDTTTGNQTTLEGTFVFTNGRAYNCLIGLPPTIALDNYSKDKVQLVFHIGATNSQSAKWSLTIQVPVVNGEAQLTMRNVPFNWMAEELSGLDFTDVMRIIFTDIDSPHQLVMMSTGQTIEVNFSGIEWRESAY